MTKPAGEFIVSPDGAAAVAAAEGLRDPATGVVFPFRDGVLHVADPAAARGAQASATVAQFGESWRLHGHLADYHERQFRNWIAPLEPADVAGRTVLEAGCGKGRHSRLLAAWRPERLICVDLSAAIYQAAANTAAFDNVHCVKADLLHLPFPAGCFDVAICVGVLHHLADPEAGLLELWRTLNPGGTLCLWVYAREGNGWVVALVDPIRKGITSRIPTRVLRPLVWPLAVVLFLVVKTLYRRPALARWLPYGAYLHSIARFPFRELEHIVLDHLCPPIAHYLSRAALERWFVALRPAALSFRWHNRNSWTIVARRGVSH